MSKDKGGKNNKISLAELGLCNLLFPGLPLTINSHWVWCSSALSDCKLRRLFPGILSVQKTQTLPLPWAEGSLPALWETTDTPTLRHCKCPWDGSVGHAPHPLAGLPQWNNIWEWSRQGPSRTSTAVSKVKMLPRQDLSQGCFWAALAMVLCYHFLCTEGRKSETWCLVCLNPQDKLVCLCNTSAWHNKLKCYREAHVWDINIFTFVNQTYTISH